MIVNEMTMLILTVYATIITLICGFLLLKSIQLIETIEFYESERKSVIEHMKDSLALLTRVHDEFERVSKYPVVSDEPIVRDLVKLVNESRIDLAYSMSTIKIEEQDEKEDTTKDT